jgi:hypothetical protein
MANNFSLVLFDQGLPHFFRLAVSSFVHSLRGALTCVWLTPTPLSSQRVGMWETTQCRLVLPERDLG